MPSIVFVSQEIDAWSNLRQHWRCPDFHIAKIVVYDRESSQIILSSVMIIPTSIPTADKFSLFSEDGRSLTIEITPAAPAESISEK
jgi:hypothetical protein